MNKTRLFCAAAAMLLAGCGEDGVSPNPVRVDFRVVSATASSTAQPAGVAQGEAGRVVITGTFVGECTTGLEAEARQYGDHLVLDLLSRAGARMCEPGAGRYAFQYESVLTGLKPGKYQVEVLNNAGPFNAPTQIVTVR